MYESKSDKLLPWSQFAWRVVNHWLVASAIVLVSLGIGIAGYMAFDRLSFLDALVNASMLLGGMGQVYPPVTASGKVFTSIYALYGGCVFIVTAAVVLTPVVHRTLHHFHMDDSDS